MFPNIDAERARHKMTQHEIANRLGVSVRTFQNWMLGKSEIPASALIKMAQMWGKTTDYLLGLTGDNDVA